MVKISRLAADALINFLNGFAKAIRDKAPQIRAAGWNVAKAMVDGMLGGLKDLWHKVKDKLNELADSIPGTIKKALSIFSPSRVMMDIGKQIVLGLVIGIGNHAHEVTSVMSGLGDATKGGITAAMKSMGSVLTDPLGQLIRRVHDVKGIGQTLGADFLEGLTGGIVPKNSGKSDAVVRIEDTFQSLRDKLTEEQGKLEDQVKQDRANLNDVIKNTPKDLGKIQAAWATLMRDQALLATATGASSTLMNSLKGQKAQLEGLANEYDTVTAQLQKAQEIFDTYNKQYDTLPDFTQLVDDAVAQAQMTGFERWDAIRKADAEKEKQRRIDQVALYEQSLQQQIDATTTYMETLSKLRAAGLDDQTYQKLLEKGTAGQEFASQLLRGGPNAINQVNQLDQKLASAAATLADNAAKELYNAGQQAAIGLVKALQDKQTEIRQTMEFIAASMVDAIKKQLRIKSPSRVFAEIGAFTVQGLADGLTASTNQVTDAASSLGDEAAAALTDSLTNISERVQNGIDTDVTITPVLDLTQVQKDASKIQDLTNVTPITAAASYGQATAISSEQAAAAAAQADSQGPQAPVVQLEQNNYSPKALDDIEIYRQTKNQLSTVKSALGLVTKTN
jgi:uncharacterized protein CbrC (UPF0167 family)